MGELRFQELKGFKERHGHCNIPREYSRGLGTWAVKQRHLDKEGCRLLDASRVQKLEELGFSWSKNRCFWEERFQQLWKC